MVPEWLYLRYLGKESSEMIGGWTRARSNLHLHGLLLYTIVLLDAVEGYSKCPS